MMAPRSGKLRNLAALVMISGIVAVAAGCGAGAAGEGGNLSLVAYSTPREAYGDLTSAFQETDAGQDVTFDTSFGSSGEQSRAVEGGLPADIVAFSLAPDMDRLVEAELVEPDWADDEYDGMVTNSVVVLAVREGNPENIQGWEDLTREGIEVINPNPFTSGGAKWNIMAAYGAQLELGASEEEAVEYLRALVGNIPIQDKSARESLATFQGGAGDVLLGYENEIIQAQEAGEDIEYIIPDQTILIENPIATTTESAAPETAQAFLDFLLSNEGQTIFGERGYRPVDEEIFAEFDYPEPEALFTIADLGGWDAVNEEFFDPEQGTLAEINREVGAPTE